MADEKLIFEIGFDLDGAVQVAIKDGKKAITKIQKELGETPIQLDVDTKSLRAELKKLNDEWNKLSASQRAGVEGTKLREQYRALTLEANGYTSTLRSAVSAENKATAAKQRATKATERQTNAYKTQGGYLQRLVQRMIAYASIAQAFSFVRNIRDVTAEFELQRVALGSIIGDLNEANKMFEQIKAAAVKSPFQIKELVTYTKQLAAYKVETDELFETTQRLADISAGLGVGMERLVLAYGQIRATGYLRASEVRQLTEAGIPIIEELAKKMSQLRGETVSAAEVMGLISERAISFGMVKEVFEDMTSAGGMFYKMQEKQAETLAGQWSNLQDAISIMYDEIGRTENVNNVMKDMIGLVKTLAENWRDVWIVVKSLSMAMGVYYVAMKNAKIASTALTIAEAKRLAIENKQMIIIPKWLAFFDTKNRLYKVSIALEKALAYAQLKTATATGVLSKAFWKLSTAILSNPYTAVLAGLVAIGVAIWNFSTKVKTTEERVDDLNKSIVSLTDLKKDVQPLVDELDVLSQKANKTATEQKRLNQITQELADKYPSTISAVREYGREVDITAEKVRELYEAELKAKTVGLRAELIEDEKALAKLQTKYNAIRAKQVKGTKTKFLSYGGIGSLVEVPLTQKEMAELNKEARELEEEMRPLEQSIHDAKVALGDIASEATRAIDAFGSWKKTIKDFKTGLKNDLGEDIKLFDDDIINQFTNLNDALNNVAEQYNKNDEAIKRYTQTLTSKKLTQAERDDIEDKKTRATAFRDTAGAILDYYNARSLLNKKTSDNEGESELSILQKELQLHEKIYAKYKEYRKYMSDEQARAKVEDYFGDTIKSLMFEPKYDSQGFKQVLKQYQDYARTLPESEKVVLDIGFKVEDIDWQDTKTELEDNIKKLSDQLSHTKTAKDFFNRILGMTGDKQLSATLTLSVYGTTGDDLKDALVKQVEQAFKGVDISGAIDYNTMTINYQKLAEIYAKNQDKMLDANKSLAESIVEDGQKTSASQIEQWTKELEAVKTYADKRVDIARQTQKRIAEIEASNVDDTTKANLKNQYLKKEEDDLAKLEFQAFKESPMYVSMFDSLDTASTTMLNNMRDKLLELKQSFNELDMPTELKEIQSRLNEIDEQLASKNPFKALSNAFKEYRVLREQGTRKDVEQDLIDKTNAHANAVTVLTQRIQEAKMAQIEYESIVKLSGKDSALAKAKKSQVDNANKAVENQKEIVDGTEEAVKETQKLADAWEAADDMMGEGFIKADLLVQAIINLGRNLADAFGGFGSEADAEYFDTMANGLSNLSSGIKDIGVGIASGNPISIIQGIGSAISGLSDIFTAGRVRRANKEIERQKELLEGLEYAYERLEKAQDKALGSDYISNYEKRLKNLQAQQKAYLKQAEAERSKGKKADKDKIKEYENAARDTADSIKDMQSELQEYFLGTDLTSAARDFANAWIEAYKEFGSTTDAMGEKFRDMVQNMVVESLAGKIMQQLLKPVFDAVDSYSKDGNLDEREIASISNLASGSINSINSAMVELMDRLRASGLNIRNTSSQLTGISRDIASASEESILGLAAGINTQNFYISQVPPKLDTIIALLQGGTSVVGGGVNMQDLITIQNQHLAYLPNIAQNTAETVARCERAANACERIADNLDRVIKPRGTQSTHVVNTNV